MHTNFEKRKVPQEVSGNFAQKWLLCKTIFVPLSVAKVLGKQVRSSSYLVLVFFKENSYSHGKFNERLFLLQLFYTKFFEAIFFRTPISG